MSSAYSRSLQSEFMIIDIIYDIANKQKKRKSNGLSILPCGTPQLISSKLGSVPLTLTNRFLPVNFDWNHLMLDTPIDSEACCKGVIPLNMGTSRKGCMGK